MVKDSNKKQVVDEKEKPVYPVVARRYVRTEE